jgi:hypothetical protein
MSKSDPQSADGVLPWQRQPDEPGHWFDRFDRFARTQGYEYTLRRAYWLYLQANPDKGDIDAFPLWQEFSTKYDWQQRAKDYADFERDNLKSRWESRRRELLDEDWDTGGQLRKIAREFLDQANSLKEVSRSHDPETGETVVILAANFTVGDLARLAKTGSELQRLGVGEPTSIQGTAKAGVGIYLPAVTPEESKPDSE